MSNLIFSKIEIKLCFIVWITSIAFSIYSVTKTASGYFTSTYFKDTYDDFSNGWLKRKKDISDTEWKYVKIIIIQLIPWCFVHQVVAELLRKYNKQQFLRYWYPTISLFFVYFNLGIKNVIYFSLQPFFGYFALQFKSKNKIWIYYIITLALINYYKYVNITSEIIEIYNFKEFITITAIFWINLRSLNYYLEVVNDEKQRKFTIDNIVTSFAYCLYLPFLFTGPLVLYKDFKIVFENNYNSNGKLKELSINLIRYITWAVIIEVLLHYCYITALSYQPELMENISSWALYGAGYCMGQYFQMKYVVFYGLSTSIAKFDGVPVPRTPICIARVHLYSDMWKYFDEGLYLFLLRYIYIPACGAKKQITRKIFGSFLCFLFVFVWHGLQSCIAIWSFLNFIGVVIESLSNIISKTYFYQNNIKSKMSEEMHRRFVCLLTTPLFAMSSISNFYFFAGKEIGDIYTRRFSSDIYVSFNVLIILYFGSQVSTEIKNWEIKRNNRKIVKKT